MSIENSSKRPPTIVIANQEGNIVLVNAQAEKLFGYKRAELLDQSIEILIPERMRGKHRFHRADYMSCPVSRPMETDLQLYGLRKDGTEFPAEISLSPIQTPSGLLIASAIRDVTDRYRAKRRILTLLDSAPDAMVVVGEDGSTRRMAFWFPRRNAAEARGKRPTAIRSHFSGYGRRRFQFAPTAA